MVFELAQEGGDHIFVHALFSPEHYDRAKYGENLDLPDFSLVGAGMAEGKRNPEQEIMLNKAGYNSWYWKSEEEHRFDDGCSVVGNRRICRRTVRQYLDINAKDRKSTLLSDMHENQIYIVVLKTGKVT